MVSDRRSNQVASNTADISRDRYIPGINGGQYIVRFLLGVQNILRMLRIDRTLFITISVVVVFSSLVLPLSTSGATISLEYSLGFNGHFQLGTWTPLTVLLENRGRTTTGTLEVLVTSGSEFLHTVRQTPYTMDVELPYNSTKMCAFTILLDSFTHNLVIRLHHEQEVLVSRTISLRSQYIEKPLAVVADERITPDFLSILPQDLFPVNARPKFLPENWYGYESVKLLIINAEVLKSLRARQYEALLEWVRQGGFLVTAGSMNYGVFLEERVQQIFPMRILGHRQFSEVSSFAAFAGQPLASPTPFLVLHVQAQDAQVLLEEDDIPLILERPIGAGKMLFIAIDLQHPPFSRWAGRQHFWEMILSLQPMLQRTVVTLNQQKILAALFANMPTALFDKTPTFVFLAIYLIVLMFVLKSRRTMNKPKNKRAMNKWKRLGSIFVVIVLFSVAGYILFFYPSDSKRLVYDGLFHLHISGEEHHQAFGNYILGLYAMKDTSYNLGFEIASYPVTSPLEQESRKAVSEAYTLYESETGRYLQGQLEKWSHNFFLIPAMLEFPVSGQAYQDDHGVFLTITNMTPYSLLSCSLYLDDRVFLLGDISPNGVTEKAILSSVIRETEPFDGPQAQAMLKEIPQNGSSPFWQNMQRDLTKDLFLTIDSTYEMQPDMLILVGWIPSGLIREQFMHSGVVGKTMTLVTWKIPVKRS